MPILGIPLALIASITVTSINICKCYNYDCQLVLTFDFYCWASHSNQSDQVTIKPFPSPQTSFTICCRKTVHEACWSNVCQLCTEPLNFLICCLCKQIEYFETLMGEYKVYLALRLGCCGAIIHCFSLRFCPYIQSATCI